MLHYCTVDDVSKSMSVSSRYLDTLEMVRDGVTDRLNEFIRRRLDYAENCVEYFDAVYVSAGNEINLWLERRNLVPGSVLVEYSQLREWDGSAVDAARYIVEHDKGRVSLYGPYPHTIRGFRIKYNGGYTARLDNAGLETDAMHCPASLRDAAIQQTLFNFNNAINMDQGKTEEIDKGMKVKSVTTSGLLVSVAHTFMSYRKPLGGAY